MKATDDELLKLAAKSAGYEFYDVSLLGGIRLWGSGRGQTAGQEGRPVFYFDSLQDDGDAFRMALARPGIDLTMVVTEAWQATNDAEQRASFDRRAITTTMAKVGKGFR
ncbi:hypothetical protein SJI00_21005 [Pseudomonas sp. RP23018S]|uniref:hypothetical protein n=1 Tax=Pseudomonas sp. RP23018S TaxID=3096037 RepID=UPI002ACA5613|nr:hypothetical protein [Pseudomonas sp. RP23018S]MDZ5605256.1 hypothetical protein [Pseudomonas sp. RP23018S]